MDCERWPRLFTSTPTSIDLPSNGNFVRKIKRVGSPIFRKLISRLSNVKKKRKKKKKKKLGGGVGKNKEEAGKPRGWLGR